MMTGWLDTHGCPEHFHVFKRDENRKPVVCHQDGTVCTEAEYRLSEEE